MSLDKMLSILTLSATPGTTTISTKNSSSSTNNWSGSFSSGSKSGASFYKRGTKDTQQSEPEHKYPAPSKLAAALCGGSARLKVPLSKKKAAKYEGSSAGYVGICDSASRRQKCSISINWEKISKEINFTTGLYNYDNNNSWKNICYRTRDKFEYQAKQLGLTPELFYNIIILIELLKKKDNKAIVLEEYFNLNHPGLFGSKKDIISKQYDSYINYISSVCDTYKV